MKRGQKTGLVCEQVTSLWHFMCRVKNHRAQNNETNREYAYALYSEAHNILYVTVGTCEPIPRIVWNAAIGVRRRLNLKAYSSR